MKTIINWLNPPVFANDAEKTAQARLLNIVGLQCAVTLLLAAGLYVPFFVRPWPLSWLIILTLLIALLISHAWARQGRLRLASFWMISVAWLIFFGITWISGGILGAGIIYIAAVIVTAALLLGARASGLLTLASVLSGMGLALLQERGYTFPTLLTFTPLREWAVLALGLGFIISVMNLVLRSQKDALTRARQENLARRQAEAARRVNEQSYRNITEQMSDLVFTTDARGVITYLSAATQTLFGYGPSEMVGRHFTEFLSPASVDTALAAFSEMVAHGQGAPVLTLEMKRADGMVFHGELKSARFEDAGEVGTLGIIRDISDRVQVETALYQNEQRLTFALAATNDGLWDWNLITHAAYFSPQYYRMLGYEPEAFPPSYENWRGLLHPQDLPVCETAIQTAINQGQGYDVEFRMRTQAGGWKWIMGRGKVMETDAEGRPVRMVGTHVDITERKQAELEIQRRTEKLSALYALSRRVSASLSLDHLITATLDEIFTAARPDVAYFFLREGERLLLRQIVPERARAHLELPEHRVGECMCGLAVTQGQALYSRDIFADLRCTWTECKAAGFRAFAALPLSNGAEILGIIGLATTYERDFESEAEFLETLVGEVSIRFQNVRLYEQLKAHTAALEAEIAERRRVEASLRESESRIQSISNNLASGMIYQVLRLPDGRRQFTYLSGTVQSFYGITPQAGLADANLIYGRIHPEDRVRVFQEEERAAQNHTIFKTEVRMLNPAEEIRWSSFVSSPRALPDDVLCWDGIEFDITDRKRVEEALQISLEKYRLLFETLPLGVTITDEHGHIMEANQSSERMLGLSRAEQSRRSIAGPDWRIIRPDGTRLPAVDYPSMRALHTQRLIENVEMGVYKPDGSLVWLNVTAAPISLENYGVVIVYNDITARKEMEEHLRRQEQLAAIGQLAAGIAHDFRNLLTSIILYAQLGLHKPGLPNGVAQGLEIIVGESRKATDLVQQILDFSSRGLIERRPIELGDFTRKVLTILQRTIPESVHITVNIPPGEFVVAADTGRLQQVLTNLALNARDAMPEGGQLQIDLSGLRLHPDSVPPTPEMAEALQRLTSPLPKSDWVCLSVSDTGTGMTEDVRAHLFQPFFTTKEPGKGVGLGLAQVYGIIRQHDGYIGVKTEVGQGTTFHLYLPTAETITAPDAPAKRAPTLPGKGETILLVEDNLTLRDAGQNMLAALGYRVLTASNGREALQIYQAENEIALVVTDLVMPEMGGKALMEALRERRPDVKVLAITGYTPEEDLGELRTAGFRNVIHKPFDIETLAQEIRRALDEPA